MYISIYICIILSKLSKIQKKILINFVDLMQTIFIHRWGCQNAVEEIYSNEQIILKEKDKNIYLLNSNHYNLTAKLYYELKN